MGQKVVDIMWCVFMHLCYCETFICKKPIWTNHVRIVLSAQFMHQTCSVLYIGRSWFKPSLNFIMPKEHATRRGNDQWNGNWNQENCKKNTNPGNASIRTCGLFSRKSWDGGVALNEHACSCGILQYTSERVPPVTWTGMKFCSIYSMDRFMLVIFIVMSNQIFDHAVLMQGSEVPVLNPHFTSCK